MAIPIVCLFLQLGDTESESSFHLLFRYHTAVVGRHSNSTVYETGRTDKIHCFSFDVFFLLSYSTLTCGPPKHRIWVTLRSKKMVFLNWHSLRCTCSRLLSHKKDTSNRTSIATRNHSRHKPWLVSYGRPILVQSLPHFLSYCDGGADDRLPCIVSFQRDDIIEFSRK